MGTVHWLWGLILDILGAVGLGRLGTLRLLPGTPKPRNTGHVQLSLR